MPHQRIMEFQELAIRYMCCKCDGVLTDPVQLPCGHSVCERCFIELFADKTKVICKIDNCGIEINKSKVFLDMYYRREIQNIKVYCTNKEHGCEEVIPWKMLQDHIMTNCKYVQKNTPYGTELSSMQDEKYQWADHGIYREFLEGGHQEGDREKDKTEACELTTIHEDFEEGGDQEGDRKKEQAEACELTTIRKDFERLRESRNKTQEHVRDLKEQNKEEDGHIKDAVSLQKRLTLTGECLDKLIARLEHHSSANHDGVLIWKIQDYTRGRQEVDHVINSPPFYTGCHGYKMWDGSI